MQWESTELPARQQGIGSVAGWGWSMALWRSPPQHGWCLGIGLVATVVSSIGAWHQTRSRDEARFLARTEALRNGVAQELDSLCRGAQRRADSMGDPSARRSR